MEGVAVQEAEEKVVAVFVEVEHAQPVNAWVSRIFFDEGMTFFHRL
jgi:hypothetical protein